MVRLRLVDGTVYPPPGRIDFGMATGFTARRTMGLGAMKLDDVREYVRVVRALLNRETTEYEIEGKTRKIRFLNPDLELVNTTDPIDFHFSAFGPKGKQMAAEMGMNWIVPVRDADGAIAQLKGMQKAWTDAGRDLADLYATAHAGGCVLGDDEALTEGFRSVPWTSAPDEDEIGVLLDEFDPHAVIVNQWNVGAYRRVARKLRGRTLRIVSVHNPWDGRPRWPLARRA